MKTLYFKCFFLFTLLISGKCFAQVPYEWPIINSEITQRFDTINTIINSKWSGQNYCTAFAGNLLAASTNRGYYLFTPQPPSVPDTVYQNKLLLQVDTMLIMMQAMGYKAVDISINYPVLVDSFPNKHNYLVFEKKVYALARNRGFKIIENVHTTILSGAEPNLLNDVNNFLFKPNGTPDTLTSQRYLRTKTQMMQTIIDSLAPDYMTLEMEPNTQNANLDYLFSFSADSCLSYVNYFLTHLNKRNTLLGAGAGTWNNLSYFEKYATTNIDYMDYHIYPVAGTCFNPEVFQVDSIAKAYGKKLIIGECWCHKNSDSEWAASTDLSHWSGLYDERDDFSYFEHLDTTFVQLVVNLSQQSGIELVNFFKTTSEFGYLDWVNSIYGSMPISKMTSISDSTNYSNMYNQQLGPLGVFTKKAVLSVTCVATGLNSAENSAELHQNGIELYPNPAETYLQLTNLPEQKLSYTITNVLGQVKQSCSITQNNATVSINTSSLPNGVYFMLLVGSNGYVQSAKFVKQ